MIYGEGYALYTGNNKTHLNYTQTKTRMHKLCSAHFDTGQNTHRAVLYSVLQYNTQARAGSKDGTVSDRLTWGLVSTLSHVDLFTIPFVSEKPSQYSLNAIRQCDVIFVSSTS